MTLQLSLCYIEKYTMVSNNVAYLRIELTALQHCSNNILLLGFTIFPNYSALPVKHCSRISGYAAVNVCYDLNVQQIFEQFITKDRFTEQGTHKDINLFITKSS